MAAVVICKIKHKVVAEMPIKHKVVAEMPIKHEVKLSVLLVFVQRTECYILCIVRARPCFNCFKEFTHECLVTAYLFQVLSI